MGEIVQMPKRNTGNGAREAVMEIVRNPHFRKPLGDWDVHTVTDCLLMELWQYGYKIVPIYQKDSDSPPAA